MSIYLSFEPELNGESPLLTSWSNSELQTILAVATNGSRVTVFHEEGEPIDAQISRICNASFLRWHPTAPLLAIGWEDGAISLWNSQDKLSTEDTGHHKAKISSITFSPDGSRMVTGDEKGAVTVWRTSRGQLSPICQYVKDGAITHCIFCGILSGGEDPVSPEKMNSLFFFGGESGSVYLADDAKHCSEVCKVGGHIKSLLYYIESNSVVIITSSLLFVLFRITQNEKLVADKKVKLAVAGNPEKLSTIWAGPGLLTTVSGENMLRMWNLGHDENYVLSLAEFDRSGSLMSDSITCVAYNERTRSLAAGTRDGRVLLWKCIDMSGESPCDSEGWEPQAQVQLDEPVSEINWGSYGLVAKIEQKAIILNETVLKKKFKHNIFAVQSANNVVELRKLDQDGQEIDHITVESTIKVKGFDINDKQIVIWDGKKMETQDFSEVDGDGKAIIIGTKETDYSVLGIHSDNVVGCKDTKMEICNFYGVVKQTLTHPEAEGDIIDLDISKRHGVAVTSKNFIKLLDVSRREYKALGAPRKFEEGETSLGVLRNCKINCNGTKVCLLADSNPTPGMQIPDTKFYVFDIEYDSFLSFDVGPGYVPMEQAWDSDDPRLVSIQVEAVKTNGSDETEKNLDAEHVEKPSKKVMTFFVTSESKIKRMDETILDSTISAFVGLKVPTLFCVGKDPDAGTEEAQSEQSRASNIVKKTLRDFAGLSSLDENTKKAILNFSFHLTCGNMDEAYKAVKSIQNVQVWENMAQMCIKTKRIDVAEVCLANMRFARGARAVREVKDDELEARLAMAAIQLNMIDDAKRLYAECKRYDLLNKLLQACGEWEEALKVAEENDRINLKTTHFNMAKNYELQGDFESAIHHYEKSGTHRHEVTRMLCLENQFEKLEEYIEESNDPTLFKWLGQYVESKRNYDMALKYYEKSQDYASLVRLFCFLGEINEATRICMEEGNEAACYHLARQLDNQGQFREAIQFYQKSGRVHHAIRLAKENGMPNEVMALAVQSNDAHTMVNCARWFKDGGMNGESAQLYKKVGNITRAFKLAIEGDDDDDNWDDGEDVENPAEVEQMAKTFYDNGKYLKAAKLYLRLRNIPRSLEICLDHDVALTEDMAEAMTPEANETNMKERKEIVTNIAKVCKRNGNFQLACKKYTQAGEKVKAIKCLLKLGEPDKIMFFANTAKNREVYVLAANYLQNSNWHNEPDIMKAIINYYTRAKAFEQLSGFYADCSQVEIDEYRDYDKALGALKESLKYMVKSDSMNKDALVEDLQERIKIIEKFIHSRRVLESDPQEMVNICNEILAMGAIEKAIRAGDVFAQVIEFFYQRNQMEEAYNYIEDMRKRKIPLNPYIDREMIQNITQAVGGGADDDDDDDGVDEDIDVSG